VLASDNVRRSEDDRDADIIGIIQTGAAISVQLTETFNFSLAGNFTVLPFEGKAGFSGYGLSLAGPFLASLNASPLAQGQLANTIIVAGWPVTIADDFRVSYAGYSANAGYPFVLFEGFEFDEVDRAGRYVFTPRRRKKADRDAYESENTRDFLYISNVVSTLTERLLPGNVRLRAGIFHENLWYNRRDRGLPRIRDEAFIAMQSERENMRFKPYATYRAVKLNTRSNIAQQINVGVRGPITDQLTLTSGLGYFLPSEGHGRLLWRLRLNHVAGPYTTQSLHFYRGISEFTDFITTRIGYRLYQTLGPRMNAQFFAHYSILENTDDDDSRELLQTGLRLYWHYSPRTKFKLSGVYTDRRSDTLFGSATWWTGRFEMRHNFTDSLTARLYYQFKQRNSERRGEDFYENLVFLSVTKYIE
jgi:hypothetical protein